MMEFDTGSFQALTERVGKLETELADWRRYATNVAMQVASITVRLEMHDWTGDVKRLAEAREARKQSFTVVPGGGR
jgi:hypothetical protein